MNFNNFTIKAQEVVQKAQQIAHECGHQLIENTHIFKAILNTDENATPFILKKLGVNIAVFEEVIKRSLENYPKVSGGTVALSRTSNNTLLDAGNIAKKMKDEFVAVEHLLLALLKNKDVISQQLKDQGITEKGLKAAIDEMRGGQHVHSKSAEDTYNALSKYAKNLNQLANDGKLDPVIGRDEEIRRILQNTKENLKNV